MKIYKEFIFDSAHYLPNVPEGHPCKRMHGHTYKVRIWIKGKPDKYLGWVMDFGEIKDAVNPIIKSLDHHCLNDIDGLSNPTAENISIWFWEKLKSRITGLYMIEIFETPTTGVQYEGD